MDNKLTEEEITKYHFASVICKKVYNELKEIVEHGERNIRKIVDIGNEKILEQLSKIYKKDNKYIGFPVSISLNNCVGNYVYDYEDESKNMIQENDVIKIELGVNIGGCISILGETFSINDIKWLKKANNFLIKLQKRILKLVENGYTADDLKIFIENECILVNMFPVENSVSYQSEKNHLKTIDSKYIVLNCVKHYDNNDNLISPEFINYEFETDDVYNINLSIIPINPENDNKIIVKKQEKSHLYTLNDNTYQLKMKSSRLLYNLIKIDNSFNPFEINKYDKNSKNKIGITECIRNNILEPLPIIYIKEKQNDILINSFPVIIKKFTIIIKEKAPSKLVGG